MTAEPVEVRDVTRVDPTSGMSQAVRIGSHVHVSGQVAWSAPGQVAGIGDTRAQAQQAFANLADLLVRAGSGLADVVALRCFLTPDAVFDDYRDVKAALFPDAGPASTTVVVAALLDERLLVEIEAVAIARDGGPA